MTDLLVIALAPPAGLLLGVVVRALALVVGRG